MITFNKTGIVQADNSITSYLIENYTNSLDISEYNKGFVETDNRQMSLHEEEIIGYEFIEN